MLAWRLTWRNLWGRCHRVGEASFTPKEGWDFKFGFPCWVKSCYKVNLTFATIYIFSLTRCLLSDWLEWRLAGWTCAIPHPPYHRHSDDPQPPHHPGHPLLPATAHCTLLRDNQPVCCKKLAVLQSSAIFWLPGSFHKCSVLHACPLQLHDDGGEYFCTSLLTKARQHIHLAPFLRPIFWISFMVMVFPDTISVYVVSFHSPIPEGSSPVLHSLHSSTVVFIYYACFVLVGVPCPGREWTAWAFYPYIVNDGGLLSSILVSFISSFHFFIRANWICY